MIPNRRAALGALLLLAAGCAHLRTRPQAAPCVPTRHGCIALNAEVTEATLAQTICVPGYAQSVRPGSAYTEGVKRKLLREAGLDATTHSEYELDHLIPLALGGHPRQLSNLALQPWNGAHGAHRKDTLEVRLHARVCHGELSLHEAQRCIAEDWEACAARIP